MQSIYTEYLDQAKNTNKNLYNEIYICTLELEQEFYNSNKEKKINSFSFLAIDYKSQVL